jgi:hypothetical protein
MTLITMMPAISDFFVDKKLAQRQRGKQNFVRIVSAQLLKKSHIHSYVCCCVFIPCNSQAIFSK